MNPRHSVLVRVTHWVHTLGFFALVVSGAAILIAHPRLYWGETGAEGSPAMIELPLPVNLDQSGWGRSLHFLGAWVCVLNGIVYAISGFLRRHFSGGMRETYSVLQRLAYRGVVFVLFPSIVITGLAMSPGVRAALPAIVGTLGGHQSARTLHFFVASLLALFLIGHVTMVASSGFSVRMRAMIGSGQL